MRKRGEEKAKRRPAQKTKCQTEKKHHPPIVNTGGRLTCFCKPKICSCVPTATCQGLRVLELYPKCCAARAPGSFRYDTFTACRHAGNANIQTAKPSAVSDQRLCLRPRSGCRTSSKTPVRGFTDVPILPFSETGTRSPTANNNVRSAAFLRRRYVEFQTFGSNSTGGCVSFRGKKKLRQNVRRNLSGFFARE